MYTYIQEQMLNVDPMVTSRYCGTYSVINDDMFAQVRPTVVELMAQPWMR